MHTPDLQATPHAMQTAEIAEPISGDKLYQRRARSALPLLVRQARAHATLTYAALAEELGMPNPRNLNYVLGSIGVTLENLSQAWGTKVPPIQCLVVRKSTGLPGEGIGWFLIKKDDFASLSLRDQRTIVRTELSHIYAFQRWTEVLEFLELEPCPAPYSPTSDSQPASISGRFGAGESDEHLALKEFVAQHSEIVGLRHVQGETEIPLRSGDFLDVSFRTAREWVAVEVKSRRSTTDDVARGIFQCIKYQAVLEAMLLAAGDTVDARTVLVLEGGLPPDLVPLRNVLGVDVVEHVVPQS